MSNHRQQLINRDVSILRAVYPRVGVPADAAWVQIEEFRLPPDWVPNLTTILIVPPPNYPEAAPDGFYCGQRLVRIVRGRLVAPQHYFDEYKNQFAHLGYIWYCLEDQTNNWDPRFDNLLTFIEAIRTYMGLPD